jgi:branched-chain amino acid transport system permease protein
MSSVAVATCGRPAMTRGVPWVLAVVASAVLAAGPWGMGDYAVGVGLSLFTSVALAESWVLLSGLTGYISLGHAVFYGVGAYVMAVLWDVVPFWVGLPVAGLAACAVAAVVGWPALKVRGPYFVILTFGLAEFAKFCVVEIESGLGNFGRLLLGAPSLGTMYEIMLGLAVAATFAVYGVQNSRFGAGLRAIREDETAAETIGINVRVLKLAAFAASSVIPGMVGAVMAMRSTYFEPMQGFSPLISFGIVTTAMVGGSSTPAGPILGSIFLVGASELLWANAPEIYNILLGVLLVGFVLGAPHGIVGWLQQRRGRAP